MTGNEIAQSPVTKAQTLTKEIVKWVGLTFRHLVPGVLVLGAISMVRPEVVPVDEFVSVEWLAVLSIIALTIGNVWYVAHRYVVQQLVDFFGWVIGLSGSPPKGGHGYFADVADSTWKYFSSTKVPEKFLEHLDIRRSSVVLLYISSEVILFATLFAREPSLLATHRSAFKGIGIFFFVCAFFQNWLTWHLEQLVCASAPLPETAPQMVPAPGPDKSTVVEPPANGIKLIFDAVRNFGLILVVALGAIEAHRISEGFFLMNVLTWMLRALVASLFFLNIEFVTANFMRTAFYRSRKRPLPWEVASVLLSTVFGLLLLWAVYLGRKVGSS